MEIIGFIAATLTTLAFVPQVIKVHKTNSLNDISLMLYIMFCSGVFLWLIYGVMINSSPVIIANAFTLLLASYILFKKIKSLIK